MAAERRPVGRAHRGQRERGEPARAGPRGGRALRRAARPCRLKRHDRPAPAGVVDDVDGVVLAVGAGNAEEEAEPAPEAELPLARELVPEEERAALLVEIDP